MKIRNLFLKAFMILMIIFLSGIAAKPVQAYVSFKSDGIIISVGDIVYLPYMMNTSEYIEKCYMEDENSLNPVITLKRSISGPKGYGYEVIGERPGVARVYAVSENGNYGAITIEVKDSPMLQKNETIQIFYPAGHASKMYRLYVESTGIYRFQHAGPDESEIIVYDESHNVVAKTDYGYKNGVNKLDVMLNGGSTYFVTARTYDDHIVHSEERDQIYQFAWGNLAVPTKVSILPAEDKILTQVGNTCYLFEDESVHLKVISHSDSFLTEDSYIISSSNPSVADWGKSDRHFFVNTSTVGETILEAKTVSGVTGTLRIKVIRRSDIIPGDLDMDGIASRKDLLTMYHIITGKLPDSGIYWYADINHDDLINYDDIKEFQRKLGGLPFADVDPKDWYYQSVEYCYKIKIMSGMNDVEFVPLDPVTRSQLPAILYRLEGSTDITYEPLFLDVQENMWYTDGVLWANENDIVYGYADSNTFGILDKITREQIAVMLYRYAGYKEYDRSKTADYTEFIDSDSVSPYADEAMKWAVGNKFIVGNSDGTLNPLGMATRAEVASIIQRFLEAYASAE